MDILFLNFPTFFHSAIKSNTSLPQFNAVSVMLLGDVREKCTEDSIDDPSVSGYVNGKKPIRKSILMPLLAISHEEVVRRLYMLGIQDIQRMVDALTTLIGEVINLSNTAKAPLLALAEKTGADYDFVAEVFLAAVKCPPAFTRRLSREMIQHLHSLGGVKQFTSIPISLDPSKVTQETVSNSEDISGPDIQEENAHVPIGFLQEVMEVSISYRSLTIPEDKETAINYFLGAYSSTSSVIELDYADAASIISETEGYHYSLVELRGTRQSITFEFSRWEKLPNCTGCIVELEMPFDMGLDDVSEIVSHIENLIHKDANFILGVKIAQEFLTDQAHVCAIFQMRDTLSESIPTKKSGDPNSHKSHNKAEKILEDDPWDEILRIFNKKP